MEPKPKRIKIDVACEACRRRKVKCDGARPACGNCWKRTDLRNGCSYSSEPEKPLAREQITDSGTDTPMRALRKITHSPEANFAQPPLPPVARPTATPKSTTSSGPDPTRRSRMDRHPITPSDASPSVVDSMTTVREDGTVTGEYFGSSSAGSFTNQIKAAIDARLGSATETRGSRSSLFKPSLPLSGEGPGGQVDYVLPARKQADHLMDLYWYYVDPLYPFLDRQRFEHCYHALFAGTSLDADERIFVSILNIIFALATQLIESMPPEQRDSSSQGYQGFFVKSLELYEIINQVVLAFYTTTSGLKSPTAPHHLGQSFQARHELDLGTALQLDQRLTRWEKGLPTFLTMAEPETQLGEVFRRQAVIMRIRLLHARMLLLRPMLARFCLSESSPTHDDLSSRVMQQCAMVCVEAAQNLISVIVQFQKHDGTLGLLPAWWYRVFYIYTAATVLIAARLRPAVFSSLDISRSWNQGMALLKDHENLGPSPRRCAAALQILSTKMFQEQPQSTALPNSETDPAAPNIINDQETFDMPFPYLGQDATFDMDAISFDVNDFSWLNSMPGSL
ncbi:C6 transcription factor [Colletotrichum karsti]|uniref:C6 transcription factor n=1 Tax=Colletotrichum karsti TaxID=1095194 RepID=A0A9P6LEJ4_9PEZI|nr:C6 transcription factor [Colletotrichum karsti]KAF9869297.1 C6 transcription factor [Colletotrichum karsti]